MCGGGGGCASQAIAGLRAAGSASWEGVRGHVGGQGKGAGGGAHTQEFCVHCGRRRMPAVSDARTPPSPSPPASPRTPHPPCPMRPVPLVDVLAAVLLAVQAWLLAARLTLRAVDAAARSALSPAPA